MSKRLAPFPDRETAVTLNGWQWTAILAVLTYSEVPPGLLSGKGAEVLKIAKSRLAQQLTDASDHNELKMEIVR